MTTPWDPVYVRGLALELARRLEGARLRALLFDHDGRALLLFFRQCTLRFTFGGPEPAAEWWGAVEPFPDSTPLPAEVRTVEAPYDERRLTLRLSRVRGTPRRHRIEFEWFPRRANAVHVAGDRIEDLVRPTRRLTRGQGYVPPPRRDRTSGLDQESWIRMIQALPENEREQALLQSVAWASRFNAPSLLAPSSTPGCGWPLWAAFEAMTEPQAVDVRTDDEWSPYPLPLGLHECRSRDSLLQTFAPDFRPPLSAALAAPLERTVRRARRTLGALERELERARSGADDRATADLVLARLHSVPKGVTAFDLEGFDRLPVRIELEGGETAREFAERLYERARRADRARNALPERIREARERLSAAEAERASVEAGAWTDATLTRLVAGTARARARGKGTEPVAEPFRAFVSSGGLDILVGRGSRHNDALTFKIARPGEVWLHARDVPGAHVILRWESADTPPARDLEEAATLAAVFSGARHSGLVPVDWTRRRYVRKPRGAGPGRVLIQRAKTVFVEPDEGLVARLEKRVDESA